MRLSQGLVSGRLVARLNRFAVEVEVEGGRAQAHLANSGRLHELMVPGVPVLLAPRGGKTRKTPFDLVLVQVDGVWVSADARLPNRLLQEGVEEGRLEAFAGQRVIASEPSFRGVRLDLLLKGPQGETLVEAKSVTLVVDGVGLFPDAPTERGRRHLAALVAARRLGLGAAVVFVIQRPDVILFAPHAGADPRFAEALRWAAGEGVAVLAYRCLVDPKEVRLDSPVPVVL